MFTLAHLSDPHLSLPARPRVRELINKRAIGYFNWRARRAVHHQTEYLNALTSDLLARGFDHLAVTGDLVNLGLPSEFAAAREFLEHLGPGDRVSMVPGNHDCYVRGTALLHLDIWKEYITGDADTKNIVAGSAFPYVRRRGPLAIIGLSTAVPTGPFLATGRLGKAQLNELAPLLAALKLEHRFRVILIHHPPAGNRSPHERLSDASKFCGVIAEHGAELILHGHDHRAAIRHIAGPDGAVPVIGVTSASHHPGANPERGGAYNLYRIGGKQGSWTCSAESYGLAPDGSGVARIRDAKIW